MTKKEEMLMAKLISKLDEMEKKFLKAIYDDFEPSAECQAVIPMRVMRRMEKFIGKKINFLGIC